MKAALDAVHERDLVLRHSGFDLLRAARDRSAVVVRRQVLLDVPGLIQDRLGNPLSGGGSVGLVESISSNGE